MSMRLDQDKIKALLMQGNGYKAIGEQLGMKADAVRYVARKPGIRPVLKRSPWRKEVA